MHVVLAEGLLDRQMVLLNSKSDNLIFFTYVSILVIFI